ncbi:MAG: hypothetical protein ACP5NW_02705 [Candidatus Woesearchaeota archaeon]
MLKLIDAIRRYYERIALNDEFMPAHLTYAIDILDNALIEHNTGKNLDHKSMGENLWGIIKFEEYQGNIVKGQKVLECGTGSGSTALLWAYNGYPVTSIEIDGSLAENTERQLRTIADRLRPEISKEEYEHYRNACSNIRLFKGYSYYPTTYEEEYKGNTFVHKLERELWSTVMASDRSKLSEILFGKDPYDVISIKDFDILYAFVYPNHTMPIMDMFNRYARDDAKLALYGAGEMQCYANQMGLRTCKSGFFTERSTMLKKKMDE